MCRLRHSTSCELGCQKTHVVLRMCKSFSVRNPDIRCQDGGLKEATLRGPGGGEVVLAGVLTAPFVV